VGSRNPYEPVERRIADAIVPGERLLWAGKAPAGLILRSSDWVNIPLAALFCAFTAFWEKTVLTTPAPAFFRLWGIPFVAAGLYGLVGRFIVESYLRATTYYAVTDQAAYVIRTDRFPIVRRYAGSALDAAQLEPESNGSGNIRFVAVPSPFGQRTWYGGSYAAWSLSTVDAFYSVANVADVYRLVTEAAAGRRATA